MSCFCAGRVADFGGGFGALARMLGSALPRSRIDVVEPHPHPAAVALSSATGNVRYVPELAGEYDILVATAVFEHVLDPLGLAIQTAAHLRKGGKYLMANCFRPVIHCHLPQLFHFDFAWDHAIESMGLQRGPKVAYGRAFSLEGTLASEPARVIEERAQKLFSRIRHLPCAARRLIGSALLRYMSVSK